jgi:hypothetical protein
MIRRKDDEEEGFGILAEASQWDGVGSQARRQMASPTAVHDQLYVGRSCRFTEIHEILRCCCARGPLPFADDALYQMVGERGGAWAECMTQIRDPSIFGRYRNIGTWIERSGSDSLGDLPILVN